MPGMKPSRSQFLAVRGLRYHVREWGEEGAPKLFMLHGWMDASASFQFIVDALASDWHVIAPDWRGFGASGWGGGDVYWFPDYFADLDVLLHHFQPDGRVRLLGHSMGGNVALMYAGIRPGRVERIVALDAFGLADRPAEDAPGRYEKWLAELGAPVSFRSYPDRAALAERLLHNDSRLSPERAAWLAEHVGVEEGEGGFRMAGDPVHRRVNPVLYRRAEAEACWRRCSAPVLMVEPLEPELRRRIGVDDEQHQAALRCFRDLRLERIPDAGHNLHHHQAETVARIAEAFLLS
ncbi:pimeloyl-ACP methyl ester carboxylesterase [Azoarcus indigens]|uniref:Pimeloyl-ACP methyl ester carboxylesterase n=2 Tax=Azoarcus indigens TaxID=29545 RepID=A0A4R6EFR2_9RHOO|nr:pimeloyl-ACP methyl ester carboxylesterase [Azoarcus indigens]